ncbi:hypothetical protein [uncultured Tenacibaculum sp.]|uniref:hypothetical protein n=1 Tax=uncultured Tenacibaculum sp. TaxID=174713 RepID=UPI00260C842A|nr:hypothetical protein [uncultured Tenacibaculum sp.]
MIGLNTFLFISYFKDLITGFDLFIICSIIILVNYLKYLEKPKSNSVSLDNLELDSPLYQTNDILLQGNNLELEFKPFAERTSIWVKTIVFVLIFLVAVTPLYQLLGTEYFL